MALTIAIEGLGVLDDAESTTGWGFSGSGGISAALDNEIYYQGAGSVNVKISSAKSGWLYYDNGSALNFTTTYSGQLVYIWYQITTPGSMNTKATPGLAVRMGSSTSVYRSWTLAGSDDLHGYSGGWKCAVIDPNSAGTADSGSYNPNAVQFIGIYYNGSSASRAENVFVDTIAVGSGVRAIGAETVSGQGVKEVVDYCTDLTNRAWGMLQEREGIYYAYGQLYVGGDASADTTFGTSGRVLKWGDSEYWNGSAWVSAIGDGFNGLTIDDHASHPTYFTDGYIVGSDSGRSGNVYIGSSNIDTTFDLFGGNNTSSTTYFYGSTWQSIANGITWGDDLDHRCYSVTVQGCGQFDPVGAPQIRNCLFVSTADTSSSLLWNESIDIQDCSFISNTTGPGIEMPSDAGTPYAYNALFFSGNTYDVNNTSGNPITINKNSLSDPTTYTGSTVTFSGTSVTTEITVKDIDTGSVIAGARVLVMVSDGVNFPYSDSVSITGSGTTATVTHSTHGLSSGDNIVISGANEDEYNGVYQITVSDGSTYTYTTSETVSSSPATGTITATMALINGATNGSGIISDTRSLANNQAISGWVRKASGSPYYKQQPISDTVDKNNGKSINVQLIRDE